MDHAFEDVEVKINAPALLEDALKRKRRRCMIGTGSMSDPYMPLEEEQRLTRRCLEIADGYGFGFSLITKSAPRAARRGFVPKHQPEGQVRRADDADDRRRGAVPDSGAECEQDDARARRGARGFARLRHSDGRVAVAVYPFLNDSEENLRALLDCCVRAKVRGVVFFGVGMTLREGNREYFYEKLDAHFPACGRNSIRSTGFRMISEAGTAPGSRGLCARRAPATASWPRPTRCLAICMSLKTTTRRQGCFDGGLTHEQIRLA
jgi:hypothetical protein